MTRTLKDTKEYPVWPETVRFFILVCYLLFLAACSEIGAKKETSKLAKTSLEQLKGELSDVSELKRGKGSFAFESQNDSLWLSTHLNAQIDSSLNKGKVRYVLVVLDKNLNKLIRLNKSIEVEQAAHQGKRTWENRYLYTQEKREDILTKAHYLFFAVMASYEKVNLPVRPEQWKEEIPGLGKLLEQVEQQQGPVRQGQWAIYALENP